MVKGSFFIGSCLNIEMIVFLLINVLYLAVGKWLKV